MKKTAYILFECSGSYEDYLERPLKAFTFLKKAQDTKTLYEQKNQEDLKQAKICMTCPISVNCPESEEEFKEAQKKSNCRFASNAVYDPEEGTICPDEVWYYDDNQYKIVTVELDDEE